LLPGHLSVLFAVINKYGEVAKLYEDILQLQSLVDADQTPCCDLIDRYLGFGDDMG
jgi:hypothetical protein